MKATPKAETVKRFREATGMGWMSAKLFFSGRCAELCERILRAHEEQRDRILHDPIEDALEFKEQVLKARAKAEADQNEWVAEHNKKLRESGRAREIRERPLGSCHRVWMLMKEELKARGVSWYSPAEMNPGVHFD
jgi:DNA-binding protein H-NS